MSGTLVRLNPSSFVSDASQMGSAASRIVSATESAASRLASCSGMAGIDPMAEDFALGAKQEGGYDASMQSMVDAGVTVAQAIAGFEGYLLGLAAGYRAMELGGVEGGSNQYASLTPTPIAASCSYTGSSLGDEQRGTPQGEIMEWVENFLKDSAGIVIPTADTGKVRQAASAWDNYSTGLTTAKAMVSAGLPATLASEFPQRSAVQSVQSKLEKLIDDLAADAQALGEGCTSYATNVDAIRGELLAMLGQLVLEIAIDIGVGIALSLFTFGAGAAAGLAKAATTVARWIPKIMAVLQRLKTLIMSAKRGMALMRRASIEAVRSTISGTVANAGASLAFGNFSWDQLGGAAISSGIGGAFAGPFSHIGGNVASRGTRITARASVDGVTGAAGGIAGEWVASKVTGQDFNLLMAALVGSAGGAAAGGLTSIKNPSVRMPSSAVPPPVVKPADPNKPHPSSSGAPSAGAGAGAPGAGVSSGGGGAPAGGGGTPSGGAPSAGGSGSGAAAAGGAGVPDAHVDVPGSLGPDAPASGGTPVGTSPAGTPDAGAGSAGDAPGSTAAGDGPAGKPEGDAPASKPEVDAPASKPESDAPAGKPEVDAPVSKPEVDGAATKPAGDVPAARPDSDASGAQGGAPVRPGVGAHPGGPGSKPDLDGPTGKPEVDAPSGKPEADGPASKPEGDGPAGKPEADGPASKPEGDGPAGKPEADGPSDKPEAVGPSSEPDAGAAGQQRGASAEYPPPETSNRVTVEAPGSRTRFPNVELEPNTAYEVTGRGTYYTDSTGRVTHVETEYGSSRVPNPDLNAPAPNTTYVVNDRHVFVTDGLARTVEVHVPQLGRGDAARSGHIQGDVGRQAGPGYDGGHLVQNAMGGGRERINIVGMLEELNRSGSSEYGSIPNSFYNFEATLRAAVDGGSDVRLDLYVDYDVSRTPTTVSAQAIIDGLVVREEFINVRR